MDQGERLHPFLIPFKIQGQGGKGSIHLRHKLFCCFWLFQQLLQLLPYLAVIKYRISLVRQLDFFWHTMVKAEDTSCHVFPFVIGHPGIIPGFQILAVINQVLHPLRRLGPLYLQFRIRIAILTPAQADSFAAIFRICIICPGKGMAAPSNSILLF